MQRILPFWRQGTGVPEAQNGGATASCCRSGVNESARWWKSSAINRPDA